MNIFNYIKDRLSILDVISDYTLIKKSGLYYKAKCPFHYEKTASFMLNIDKGLFYCFGCHIGGDIITFISKIEKLSNKESLYFLIDKYRIDVPKDVISNFKINDFVDQVDKKDIYTKIYDIALNLALSYRKDNKDVNIYLLDRGFSQDILDIFKVGYIPESNIFIKSLLNFSKNEYISISDFLDAKIIFEGKNGLYTPFENRIIFPIYNIVSKIIGFGGRIFKEDDNRVKYYNSHDHQFFNKGSILYNLDKAKKPIQDLGYAILVEGYTDVISLYQNGYKNSIATLGTACTVDHLKQISRYTNKLYVLYDSDNAGYNAVLRLVSICWQVNIDIYTVKLLDGEDPSSLLLKYGKSCLDSIINNPKDIFTFFIDEISKDFFSKNLSEKLDIIKSYLYNIKFIDDDIKKDLLISKASEIFNVPYHTLKNYILSDDNIKDNKIYNLNFNNNIKDEFTDKNFDLITQLEKKIFSAIIINYNNLSKYDEYLLTNLLSKDLLNLFLKLKDNYKDNIVNLSDEEKSLLSKIIIESNNNVESFDDLLMQFYKHKWKNIVYYVKDNIKECEINGDHKKIEYWLSYLEKIREKIVKRGKEIDE